MQFFQYPVALTAAFVAMSWSSSSVFFVSGQNSYQEETTAAVSGAAAAVSSDDVCVPSIFEPNILQDPCVMEQQPAPSHFALVFPTQYGTFTAQCVRERAPAWADRVYTLAQHGYYNDNYFFRVIPGKWIQFGTNGDPTVSNIYNYTTTSQPNCAIVHPQPPSMPYCLPGHNNSYSSNKATACQDVSALSNTFGTLAMSTGYNNELAEYPDGVTWNATAELFLNTGNNSRLDSQLFVPICTISQHDMDTVVLQFPSFGEISDLGGNNDSISLGLLYQDGNSYIEQNPVWNATMAVTSTVSVCSSSSSSSSASGGDSNAKLVSLTWSIFFTVVYFLIPRIA